MLGFVSKKKLYEAIKKVYFANDSSEAQGATPEKRVNDFYYKCGCANVCNYLCAVFKLPNIKR